MIMAAPIAVVGTVITVVGLIWAFSARAAANRKAHHVFTESTHPKRPDVLPLELRGSIANTHIEQSSVSSNPLQQH